MRYFVHDAGAPVMTGVYFTPGPGQIVKYGRGQCVTRVDLGVRVCGCGAFLVGPPPVDPVAAYWWPWSEAW